jgi:hypothetical protein
MTENDDDGSGRPGPRSKVARVVEEYGLEGLGDRLERAWTGRDEPQRSLRELADVVNRELLAIAMKRADLDPVEHDVRSTYEVLTGDASSGDRVQKRRELERQGVDVERLEDDFVSHQAVHTYLRRHRGVTQPEPDGQDRIESERENLGRLRGRTAAVSADAIQRLRDADRLAIDEFDVIVDVQVLCAECGQSYEMDDFLDRGGCDCQFEE